MESLNTLIGRLSKAEISLVRIYLENSSLKDKGDDKVLSLFNFLVSHHHESPDSYRCSHYLYGEYSGSTFRMIKSKLRARLLDALLSEKVIDQDQVRDSGIADAIKIRKRLLNLNYIVFTKGYIPITFELIDEIVKKSIKYENYPTVVDALKIKKYMKTFTEGLAGFKQINKLIAHYEYCNQSVDRAADYYYQFITRKDFIASFSPGEYRKYLEEAILEMNRDFKHTKSGRIGYYLKRFETAYFQENEDYHAARNSCIELLEIVRKYPSVYTKQRIGVAFDDTGECDIFLGDYEKAVANFNAAQKFYQPGSNDFFVSKDYEIKAYLYSNSLSEAEKALKLVRRYENIYDYGSFKTSKFQYYRINMLFKNKKYKEALKEIMQHLGLSNDKLGWDISIRVLAIMCNIELEHFDQAGIQVESLRWQVVRHKNEKIELTQRDALIVQVLDRISKAGFAFKLLDEKVIDKLMLLAGDDKKYRWRPLTPELIPFHEWIAGKVPAFAKALKQAGPGNKAKEKEAVPAYFNTKESLN